MSLTSYIVWISIVVGVVSIGSGYVGWRLIVSSELARPWRHYAWLALAMMFVLPLGSSLAMRYAEKFTDPISWVAYVGLGFLSFVITLLVARDILWILWHGGRQVIMYAQSLFSEPTLQPTDPSRRLLLMQATNIGVLATAGVLTAYGVYQARRKPGIVNLEIPIAGLPAAFAGFRIVQITDIHAGLTVKRG